MQPKTAQEIDALRASGKILATVLLATSQIVKAGISTIDLDRFAAKELKKLGGAPAFLGYNGFPGVICISVNDEVVHGIPGERMLKDGDLVGLDFGVKYLGMITDSARSVIVGKPKNNRHQRLLEATEQALNAGIDEVKPGVHVGDVSAQIEAVLRAASLGIVEDLVGHGVGHQLHEPPEVPNFGSVGSGPVLKKGMSIAIEPMATLGGKAVFVAPDNWTVKTLDGSMSAHFEDTVLITEKGSEIVTRI